jgi:hypothetical protein
MALPGNFEVRNEQVEVMLREIGEAMRHACPRGFGFTLMIFSFDKGAMFYTSNAERESMIEAMQEFIAKFRAN